MELKDIVDKHFGSEQCDHPSIASWVVEETGESAQLWSCRECKHKLYPYDQIEEQFMEPLREVIRKAYTAATTGDTVSRAYNVQMILEEALSEVEDGLHS